MEDAMSVRNSLMLLTLITLALPLVVGYFNLSGDSTASAQAISETPVVRPAQAVIATEDTPLGQTVAVLGTIEANEVVPLSFQTSGQVADVLVEVGDYVEAGTVLVRLDNTAAQIVYDQAVLNLERAQLSLQELYEPVDENDLKVAQANITSAQGSYTSIANTTSDEDIQAAEWRYQQAQEAYNGAVEARGYVNTSVGDAEVQQYDAAIGAASFDLEIVRLELEALQAPDQSDLWAAGAKITQAQVELEQLQAGPTQADIDYAEVTVQNAEVQLAEAEAALNRMQLVAPLAGYVTQVEIEGGQPVTVGVEVVEISDLSQLWLTAAVDETDVAKIVTGMSAYFRLDALAEVDFPATVDRVAWLSTEADNIISYDTRLAVDTDDPRIRVGMTAEAFVELES
jgi:HlyD family secretion protein